jgi:uncharacterized RDD family membrane protein YckC
MSDHILHGEIMAPRYDSRAFFDLIVFLLCIPAAIIIALFGILTLGIGWMLYGIMFPIVALIYVSRTMGGPQQATKGMQMMNLKLVRLEGGMVDPMLAIVHSVLFWGLNVVLTPLILLATLVLDRKRTVHDLLLGTAVIRSDR